MKKPLLPLIALFVLATSFAARLFAQTDYVTIDSGTYTLKNFYDTTPLAVGDVVELGYFSQATAANPFAGAFTALSGGTITNTALTPTPGDESTVQDTVTTIIGGDTNTGAGAGQFGYELLFNQGAANLPANNQIMSILFFNNTTVASSTAFGAASDPTGTVSDPTAAWLWSNPTSNVGFQLNYSMGDAGVVWDSGDVAYTGIPEPQSAALFFGGLALLFALQRRLRLGRKNGV